MQGQTFVCDVNGWSFVKNSIKVEKHSLRLASHNKHQYCIDCAAILRNIILRQCNPALYSQLALSVQDRTGAMTPSTISQAPELRCVIALIRHGDRTPKQKVKFEVTDPSILSLFTLFGKDPTLVSLIVSCLS